MWKSGEKPVVVFVLGVPVPVFLLLVFVTLLQILMVPVGLPFPQAVVEHLSGDRMMILLIGIAVSGSTFARVLHITRGGMKEKYPVKADGSHKGTMWPCTGRGLECCSCRSTGTSCVPTMPERAGRR